MNTRYITGRCACGAISYRFDASGAVIDYCHCGMCRRWSGAPVSAWAQVPATQFEILAGRPRAFKSSGDGQRHFCPECGSSIYMSGGDTVGIMLGTADQPEALAPTAHGFHSERVPWLHLGDGLPRFAAAPPYDEK